MAERFVRDAVAAFPDAAHLQSAVDELLVSGFDRGLLSVMPPNRDIERRFGPDWRAADIAGDPATPRVGYVGMDSRAEGRGLAAGGLGYLGAAIAAGAVIASGGALALVAGLAAASGIGGGLIGSRFGRAIDTRYQHWLKEQQRRGGILLWVRTRNAEAERRACEILARGGGSGVRVIALPHRPPRRSGGVSADLAWVNKPLSEALDR